MEAAVKLWALLDDIDTASDVAKGDDKLYREICDRIQRRRFDVMSGETWDEQQKLVGFVPGWPLHSEPLETGFV